MKIKTYRFEKIEDSNFEIEIPKETVYFFETGIRRSIRIVPEYTTWNKEQNNKDEEIWLLNITCVYLNFECKIEKFQIQISHIEGYYNSYEKSGTEQNKKSLVYGLAHNTFNKRTKEDFDADLKKAIDEINN